MNAQPHQFHSSDNERQPFSEGMFAFNPMMGVWVGLWQRYMDNTMRMMSIWMNLPAEIMQTSRNSDAEDRMRDSMRAYENAMNDSQSVARDTMAATADAGKEAGNKVRSRISA